MTLAEHDALLRNDPEYQKRIRERDEALAQRSRFLDRAEAPLVRELRKAGVQVSSVWDLVNTREPYPEAIPILMEQFEGDYPPEYPAPIRDGIARALAVPVLGQEDWAILLRCFRRETDEQVRFALALALTANAQADHRQQLLNLVRDPASGLARADFAEVLHRRFRDEEVDGLLKSLITDPEIGEAIVHLLKTGRLVVR